jgi:hypothetical protein
MGSMVPERTGSAAARGSLVSSEVVVVVDWDEEEVALFRSGQRAGGGGMDGTAVLERPWYGSNGSAFDRARPLKRGGWKSLSNEMELLLGDESSATSGA